MRLSLHDIELPLGAFSLRLDLEITSPATAIFGASGTGKTSLLDLIAGLRKPLRARIEFEGETFIDTAREIAVPPHLRRIGYVPQDGALFPHLTVRGNITYGQRFAPSGNDSIPLEHVVRVLEIEGLLDRRIGFLSGGEKQRVACARALLAQPRLLLLDEPLASLDAPLKARLLPFLIRIREEFRIPLLYVTHDPRELAALCEEVIVIDQGRCVQRGSIGEVFAERMERVYELRQAADQGSAIG